MRPKQNKTSEFIRIRHEIKECYVHYKNAAELARKLEVPEINEAIYIWLQGNFIFGDFIIQYITENDIDVEELTIITLSIASENIAALSALIEKKWVEKINFVVSGYFVRTEKIKHTRSCEMLDNAINNGNFKVYTTNTHMKVALLRLKDGKKIVFHGSANMKGSQNFEQLMVENNDYLYDFNYKCFTNLIQK